ncbi:hypothetical protein B0I35DRAFT_484188 [Stachybotrys elegans]|uniref:Uncharacterized protein n=1 Tax=Stachybotrys elegans TaxID=80388 RepID=A0A8K0SFI9_9HYPO|nr:hypothetical protein B0I35DRAFT_484188 [Stachybotrys elegans]
MIAPTFRHQRALEHMNLMYRVYAMYQYFTADAMTALEHLQLFISDGLEHVALLLALTKGFLGSPDGMIERVHTSLAISKLVIDTSCPEDAAKTLEKHMHAIECHVRRHLQFHDFGTPATPEDVALIARQKVPCDAAVNSPHKLVLASMWIARRSLYLRMIPPREISMIKAMDDMENITNQVDEHVRELALLRHVRDRQSQSSPSSAAGGCE